MSSPIFIKESDYSHSVAQCNMFIVTWWISRDQLNVLDSDGSGFQAKWQSLPSVAMLNYTVLYFFGFGERLPLIQHSAVALSGFGCSL